MKKIVLLASLFFAIATSAQVVKGMPYFHNDTFYLYWLLDEGHHAGLGGLGCQQWALSTSTDLKTWKHYQVAVSIDEEREKSICTSSVVADRDKFYAFYSTRVKENDLVHLTSKNMKNWKEIESPLTGQVATPECSDYFKWNDKNLIFFFKNGSAIIKNIQVQEITD